MKRIYSLLLAVVVSASLTAPAFAIEDQDPKGTSVVSAFVGPKFVLGIYSGLNFGVSPNLTYDYVLFDNLWKGHLTVGGTVGGHIVGGIHMESGVQTQTSFWFGTRELYGLNLGSGFEVHAGFMEGLGWLTNRVVHTDGTITGKPSFKFLFGAIVGARYYFSPNFGVSLELHSASLPSWLNIGISYKF